MNYQIIFYIASFLATVISAQTTEVVVKSQQAVLNDNDPANTPDSPGTGEHGDVGAVLTDPESEPESAWDMLSTQIKKIERKEPFVSALREMKEMAEAMFAINESNATTTPTVKVNVPPCEPYVSENGTGAPIEIINLTAAVNLIASHRHSAPMVPLTPLPDMENSSSPETVEVDAENTTDITDLANTTSPVPSPTLPSRGRCVAIYIFARWCSFSAAAAPYISALAKQFSSCCMKFVAVDAADDVSGTNTFFGAGSVPQLIIYRPHRPVVRISPITNDLSLLVELVNNATGFNVTIANVSALPDEDDFNANVLPVVPIREFDMYLLVAWVHTLLTLLVIAYKFEYVRNLILSIWNYLRGFGQEIHAHLD